MSAGYEKAIRQYLPNAELVFDRFHVQQLLSKAIDEVRREEWRALRGTSKAKTVKRTRWALLKNPWNLTPKQGAKLASIQKDNTRLYRAYLLKEALADIYRELPYPRQARRRLREWLAWACRSRFAPFVWLARTIRSRFDGVAAYFKTGYTTSASEGLNTKARLATRQAFGFHSANAVRAMIELRCGGIDVQLPLA